MHMKVFRSPVASRAAAVTPLTGQKKKSHGTKSVMGLLFTDSARTVILWHLSENKLFYHHLCHDLFSSLGEKRMNT